MTVAEVRAHCMKHYNDGLDVVIECWSDAEIQELIDDGNVMERLETLASVVNEERAAAKYFSGEEEEPMRDCYRVCGLSFNGYGYLIGYEREFGEFDTEEEARNKFNEVIREANDEFFQPDVYYWKIQIECHDDVLADENIYNECYCMDERDNWRMGDARWDAPGMSVKDFI